MSLASPGGRCYPAPVDERTLRRIVSEVVREEVASVREEVASVREDLRAEVAALREDLRGVEKRLVEAGQAQFRQTADLYRGLSQRIDGITAQMGEQGGRTRGAVEALRASIENQDFRADQIQRQVDELELELRKPGV